MPTLKSVLDANGNMNVVKTADEANPDGTPRTAQWDITAAQVQKHMRGVESADHPFAKLSAGDKSAALDAANETAKQAAS